MANAPTHYASAPKYPRLAQAAQGLRTFGSKFGLLDPTTGIAPYLERIAYDVDPTGVETVLAAADLAGLGSLIPGRAAAMRIMAPRVDDLIKQGYPENTARKIASGELAMDLESRTARRLQQQKDSQLGYHSGPKGITEFDARQGSPGIVNDRATFIAKDRPIGASYYSERYPNELYELYVDVGDFPKVDALGKHHEQIEGAPLGAPQNFRRYDKQSGVRSEGYEVSSTDDVVGAARAQGYPGVQIDRVQDMGPHHKRMSEAAEQTPEGKEQFIDRYGREGGTIYGVVDPSKIRHKDAAFDPDNVGKASIYGGGAATAVVVGSGSGQAEAGTSGDASDLYTRTQQQGNVPTYENGGEVGLEQELQFRLNDPTDYYSQIFPEETSRIEAPRYPTVAKIGQGLESFSRYLEQEQPLFSLIDPVAGIGPYLTRLGYGQKSTPLESMFAALDVAGGAGDVVGMGVTPVLGAIASIKARKNALEKADELRFFDDVKRSVEKDSRPVFPAPERFFDPEDKDFKEWLGPMGQQSGGRYLDMSQQPPKEITGEYPETAFISINTDGTPTMNVSKNILEGKPDVKKNPGVPHREIKTNLIEKGEGPKGRWRWSRVPKGYNKNPGSKDKIISISDDKHYYALSAVYPKGVDLTTYPTKKSEPRLRPTKKGQLVLGNVVGEVIITASGKKHPIYDTIAVLGVAGAAILSEEEKEQQAYRYGGGVESLAHIARNMYSGEVA